MMLVTGNKILDALDFLRERAKSLETQFQSSLYVFEGDEPTRNPKELMRELREVNARIAQLQEIQAAYNLKVEVEVDGESITLQRVLQLISGANRAKTLWAKAAASEPDNPFAYGMNPRTRDKDNEYAQPVVPFSEAQALAEAATRRALAFKQAIRSGNAREVEMAADPDLFEV
jgi:hypothetical protein